MDDEDDDGDGDDDVMVLESVKETGEGARRREKEEQICEAIRRRLPEGLSGDGAGQFPRATSCGATKHNTTTIMERQGKKKKKHISRIRKSDPDQGQQSNLI